MHIVMWDLLSYDFDSKSDPAKSLEKLKRLTRNGSIIVFHDSLKAEKNLRIILPAYLQFLTDSGYQMKKISQEHKEFSILCAQDEVLNAIIKSSTKIKSTKLSEKSTRK